jgi:hypothetical protein
MQDDEDDWKEAAATMAIIYERANLTIAGTWAENSDCGLFVLERERYKARKLKDHELYIQESCAPFPHPSHGMKLDDFPLLNRAWVYQERLLSSRMVHFGKDQVSPQRSLLLKICNLQMLKHPRSFLRLKMVCTIRCLFARFKHMNQVANPTNRCIGNVPLALSRRVG